MGFARVDDDYTYKGYRLVILENEFIKAVILPEKGADIYQFIDKKHDTDFLWKTPMGIRSRVKPVPAGYGGESHFANSYAGGWQMVFPNGGAACSYQGVNLEMCGDAALSRWDYRVVEPGPDTARVVFETELHRLPFRLRREISLSKDEPQMHLTESITNLGREKLDYVWGQHMGFEGTLIRDGNWRVQVPCRTVHTNTSSKLKRAESPTPGRRMSRLPQDGEFAWPMARDVSGAQIDLSHIPGPDICACDIAYLHDLTQGSFALINQRNAYGLQMSWCKDEFPYVWCYQNFNGSYGYPWYGRGNGMVLEPITSYPAFGLSEAMARNNHRVIEAGVTVSADFTVRVLYGIKELESCLSAD